MKVLSKDHGYLIANQGPPGTWAVDPTSQGWELISAGGVFSSSEYFDLAGLSHEEKTLFFEGATVQNMLNPSYFSAGANAGDSMIMVDLMCSLPLRPNQLSNFAVYGNFAATPIKTLNLEHTIYARIRQYVVDLDTAAWGSFIQVSENQIGSLEPTASDRIYSYRIIVMGTPTTADRIDVFNSRHMLNVKTKEEPQYEYLMRLMRSYQLQQSYDED